MNDKAKLEFLAILPNPNFMTPDVIEFGYIKEGVYDLVVSAPGYLADTITGVEVADYSATYLDVKLEMDPATGNQPGVLIPEFRLYPNPAHDIIYLESENVAPGPLEIRVFSGDGQLHYRRTEYSSNHPIAISTEVLPVGLYILHVSSNDLTRSMRFVKQ